MSRAIENGVADINDDDDDDDNNNNDDNNDNNNGANDSNNNNNDNMNEDVDARDRGRPPESRYRHFFEQDPDNLNMLTCMLPPSSVSSSRQAHAKSVAKSGGAANLQRHLQGDSHAKELQRFKELTSAPHMLNPKAAAEQVINEAKKRHADNALALLAGNKKQKGDGEEWVDRALRELAFVGFLVRKGLAFECAEDLHLQAFLGITRQQQLPRRARITNIILPLFYTW